MRLLLFVFLFVGIASTCLSQVKLSGIKINDDFIFECKVNETQRHFIYNEDLEYEAVISLSEARMMLDSGIIMNRDFKSISVDDTMRIEIPLGSEVVLSIIQIGDYFIYNIHAKVVESINASLMLGEKAFNKSGISVIDKATGEFYYDEKRFENTYGVKYMCASGNCLNGYGSYLYESGAMYIGHFKEGDLMGYGIYIYEDGEKYIGNFKYGDYDGEGASIKTDGSKYIGEFKYGEFNGFGRFYFSNGKKYFGNFIDGSKSGFGVYIFTNGQKYTGNFEGDMFNGKGTMLFSGGGKYTGDFVNNKREGFGEYSTPNGTKYSGGFKNGFYHGKGTLTLSDNTVKSGNFVNGEFVGE